MYRSDYRSTAGGGLLGAAHATEIPFVFDTLDAPDAAAILGPDAPQSVADSMHAAWVRFITDGDPGWAPYTPQSRTTRTFGVEGEGSVEFPDPDRLRLWEGVR
jgi:para-nitrobenzyl esterase